jgi:hypothetical protein
MKLDKPYVFKHLNQTQCPTCKAGVKSCSIEGQHVNGEQFEEALFECGFSIRYVPNFSRIETTQHCPYSDKGMKLQAIRNTVKLSVEAAIQSQKALTDDCRARILDEVLLTLNTTRLETKP